MCGAQDLSIAAEGLSFLRLTPLSEAYIPYVVSNMSRSRENTKEFNLPYSRFNALTAAGGTLASEWSREGEMSQEADSSDYHAGHLNLPPSVPQFLHL